MAALILALAQTAQTLPLSGDLVSERVEGTRRICVYDNSRAASPQRVRLRQRQIGRGEPCPRHDPGPPAPRTEPIPSLATLTNDQLRGNERVCVYHYLGRDYEHRHSVDEACPYTPNFFN